MKELAVVVGVSYGYMTQAARGHRNMSPHVQARVEAALDAPARVEPARCANRQGSIPNGGSTYIRERARELGMSMGNWRTGWGCLAATCRTWPGAAGT